MRRFTALLVSVALFLSGCGQVKTIDNIQQEDNNTITSEVSIEVEEQEEEIRTEADSSEVILTENDEFDDGLGDMEVDFDGLNDPDLLQYVQDNIYADLTDQLGSEDYRIESVDAIFISKEYLEELEFNSQSNIYFGYTLEELDAQFEGTRYVFTLNEYGETTVEAFEEYDDTYDQVIKNVAVGSGVVLVCVTVSILTAGTGAPACVSMVFAAAAKTGATFAVSSGVISSVAAGTITAIQTGDMEESVKAAALQGSEAFKWGAITGAIAGGVSESLALYKSATTVHTPRESELKVLERTKGAKEQVSFLDGQEVSLSTKGATRPDVIVKNADGTVHAIEVKNYNLANASNRGELYRELERQITSRVKNLPKGSTQEIVLDVRGRNFPKELIDMVIKNIHLRCDGVYPNIPIQILTY